MQPESLAEAFDGQICFHGGIDIQHLLPQGKVEDVQSEVDRYVSSLGRRGGYILGPAHLFQPDVPPENILAVYS
jgi:uroporphyrinogen decarboxylase